MASCSSMPGQPGPEHHRHRAGRRGNGFQVHQRLPHRLAPERQRLVARDQSRRARSVRRSRVALLAASVLLDESPAR